MIFDDPGRLHYNIWDTKNIPDKYNTGARESTNFKHLTESGFVAKNTYVIVRNDNSTDYQISYYRQGPDNNQLPDYMEVYNYDFSDRNFSFNGIGLFKKSKKIKFVNCKFKGFRNDPTSPGTPRIYVEFDHCSFSGGVNSAYLTLKDCKIGGFTSDAMNPCTEVYAKNLYIYNLVTESKDGEVHIDGIQIYGDQSSRNNVVEDKWISLKETGNIHFDNLRFEIPPLNVGETKAGVNACIMVQLEFSDVENICFENLTVNGGGPYYPVRLNKGKNYEKSVHSDGWSHKNLQILNLKLSDNYKKKDNKSFHVELPDSECKNISYTEELYVTSVWKDIYGVAHVITTNDTKDGKNLTVKSNVGTYRFYIPRCPNDYVLTEKMIQKHNIKDNITDENGRAYSTYTWEDMPFDLDIKIPGNPSFILCYNEKGEQIRYVSLDGNKHYEREIKDILMN